MIFENHLIDQFQIGHGTWITPNNHGDKPLCPKGTMARDNWPERGPSYRDVFQTIEGGPGYWWNTKFPSPQMKYRVNGTTDCYTSQIASPGWTWDGSALGSNVPGIAQLAIDYCIHLTVLPLNLAMIQKFWAMLGWLYL